MKKIHLCLAFSVLSAGVCGTLAFAAATGQSQQANVAAATPSATSSEEGVPNYGVSIGTVDAQVYSESGLSFDYFDNVEYVAQTSEGTYMGFRKGSSWEYDEATGQEILREYMNFYAINSTEDAVTIPDSIAVGEKTYPVTHIENSNNIRRGFPSSIKAFTVPSTVTYFYWYSEINGWLDAIYMLGAAPSVGGSNVVADKVYVCDKDCFESYLNNDRFSQIPIIPYGWDSFDWMTVNVGRRGEFAQTYIEMTDADWSVGMFVKITGVLNATDLSNINNLTRLINLDLSEADFAALPSDFISQNKTLQEVILPENVTVIPQSAFNNCKRLVKVVAPGVAQVQNYAFYFCSSLTDFDSSNVVYFGNSAFDNCSLYVPSRFSDDLVQIGQCAFNNTAIVDLSIPSGISELSYRAFSYCGKLETVELPSSMKKIGSEAFRGCTSLREIRLNEGLVTINSYAFQSCSSLTGIAFPSTLTTLEANVFGYCSSLKEITLPSAFTTLREGVFEHCSSLTEITLPSTLATIGGSVLRYCTSLKTVKCKAIVPPTADGGSFTEGLDLNHCTLYIAPFAIDAYREATHWQDFYIMKPLMEPVDNIYIERPMSFNLLSEDNAVLQDNPNMMLNYNRDKNTVGQLRAEGDGTLSAGVFTIYHKFRRRGYSEDFRPTLINNAENMRADSVLCSIDFEKNCWHFVSFQYDVEMADVYGYNNTDFVVRQYNSERRATGDGTVSNWEDVPADGVLKAGKGYIVQAANNTTSSNGSSQLAVVRFPSRNTVTKNNLFTSNNIIVPLEEYPAEFAHNRSWNLVGNPYPCYYDMSCLLDNFSAPIILWRGSNYQAYSPVDDRIILRPNEAFFVQRPLDAENMVFGSDGRMDYTTSKDLNVSPGAKSPAANGVADRSVFNFAVEGCGSDDRARIVINEDASAQYETGRDAAKFFAEDPAGVEIYVDGGVKYDICERPLADGTARLGAHFAVEGEYVISLNGRAIEGWRVMLTDAETGTTVDLSKGAYSFTAKAGACEGRFLVDFKAPDHSSISDIEAAEADSVVKVVSISGVTVFEGRMSDFTDRTPGVYVVVGERNAYKVVVK